MHTATNYALPTLHITNYQKHIDAGGLFVTIMDNLPNTTEWPRIINVSVAYMQITKKGLVIAATIALNILGKSYKISMPTDAPAYNAQRRLDLPTYETVEAMEHDVKIFQRIFDAVIANKKKQIIKAITCAYANYQPPTTFRR